MTALLIQGSEKTGSPNVYLNRINFANFYAKVEMQRQAQAVGVEMAPQEQLAAMVVK